MVGKKKRIADRPYTTAEYFGLICGILREKQKMPDDILDYALGTGQMKPIRTYEFDIRNNLDYGESEGIYLDLAIKYYEGGRPKVDDLGTFKTLQTSPEAMHIMARLLADFIMEERAYVNSHLDDFTWTGVDVYAVDAKGEKTGWGYSCHDIETALKRKDELLDRYGRVIIRDNATREEIMYGKSGKSDVCQKSSKTREKRQIICQSGSGRSDVR